MNVVLLYISNFAYSNECKLCILTTNTVSRKIHRIFPVADLFFLLTTCWQQTAGIVKTGTNVHFFSYN